MKNKYLGVILCSSLLLTACGSDNNEDTSNNSGTPTNPNPNPNLPITDEDTKAIALISTVSATSFNEAILNGVIDTLIFGADEVVQEEKRCTSGSYTKVDSTYTLNKCKGVFDVGTDSVVSGKIKDNGNDQGYTFTDLLIEYSNGENETINGQLDVDETPLAVTLSTNSITVKAKKLNSKGVLTNVDSTYTDYSLKWVPQDKSNIQLFIDAKIKSTGAEQGDFNVSITNQSAPFALRIDNNEEIIGFPYSGTLTISDSNNNTSKTTIKALNSTQFDYTVIIDGKTLLSEARAWSTIS